MKKDERLDSTLDQVFARAIVLELAFMSLAYHSGQDSKVKRDLEQFRSKIVEEGVLRKKVCTYYTKVLAIPLTA